MRKPDVDVWFAIAISLNASGRRAVFCTHAVHLALTPLRHLDQSCRKPDTTSMAIVDLTSEARQSANRLPKAIHARVMRLAKRLENWPDVSGAKALRQPGWLVSASHRRLPDAVSRGG